MEKMLENTTHSTVISIRVPDFVKKELQQDSESNHITINANIAKILIQYIEWNQFVQDSGFVYTNRTFLKELLQIVDIKEIEKISKIHCVDSLKTSIMYIHGEINKNTLVKTLESWLRTSYIPYRHIEKNGSTNYVIQHGLGEKWSKYLAVVIETIAHEIGWKTSLSSGKDTLSFCIIKAE